jgi:hypothetical protein
MNLDACLLGDIEAAEDGEPVSREDEMQRVLDQQVAVEVLLSKGFEFKGPLLTYHSSPILLKAHRGPSGPLSRDVTQPTTPFWPVPAPALEKCK